MSNEKKAFEKARAHLTEEWARQPGPQARTDYFAREVAPLWVPVFKGLPFQEAPDGFEDSCDVLISLLGVSWQPSMLMAARLQPKKLVLLTTESSQQQTANGMGVKDLISKLAGIRVERIIIEQANPPVELDIYQAVRKYRNAQPNARIYVDPTGGLKSMASAVALAGFLYWLPIVYIDSEDRDVGTGMPVLGSEYPRVLHNPLEVLGEIEFSRIESAFNSGRYIDAAVRATELKERLLDQHRAEVYRLMAEAYSDWDRFNFDSALKRFSEIGDLGKRLRVHDRRNEEVGQLSPLIKAALQHEVFVKSVGEARNATSWELSVCLIVNHLAAAKRRLDHGDASAALLLLYATVERCVALRLFLDHGVNASSVDWDVISSEIKVQYHKNLKTFVQQKIEGNVLPDKLDYAKSIALSASFDDSVVNIRKDAMWMHGLATERNHCEFEHGLIPRPANPRNVNRHFANVCNWLRPLLDQSSLEEVLKAYEFPRLGT